MLHSSPMVYMNYTELIFQNLILYRTKKVQKITIFFSFIVTGACSDLDLGVSDLLSEGQNKRASLHTVHCEGGKVTDK